MVESHYKVMGNKNKIFNQFSKIVKNHGKKSALYYPETEQSSLPYFWERLSKSGIIIFDQYNFDVAPGETKAVNEFFRDLDVEIKTFPFSWMPTAYIQK